MRPQRWLILLFVGSAITAHLLSTLVPVYAGRAFAEATGANARLATLAQIALTVALLVAGRFLGDLLSNGSMEIVAQRVKRDARDELFTNLLRKRQSFHDRQRVGDILARAINDARLVDYMLSPGIATAFNGIVALAVPIAFIAALRVELLLAPVILIVVFAVALWYHLKRLHPLTQQLRQGFAELNIGFSETLAGMATVKAATQEAGEAGKFSSNASAYRKAFVRRGRAQAVYLPSLSFGLGMAIGAVHALYLYSGGSLALPQVVTYLGWLALFHMPISMSESSVPVIQEGFVASARMLHLIEQDLEGHESEKGSTQRVAGDITLEGVSFSYGDTSVLSNVSLHLPAGKTLAIVGPTGSGKTMLTKLVNRTYEPTAGRVLVDGADIREWNPAALRRQVANVHQDAFLFSKTVAENIAFGSVTGADAEEVQRAAVQARAHDFVEQLPESYATVLNEGGTTLSGGQRQRIMIARALLCDPRILILDDATSAVDAQTETAITEAIEQVMEGRTTILISHRPQQIRRADQILVLQHGEVIGQGTHEELLRCCDLYREIYDDLATPPPTTSR